MVCPKGPSRRFRTRKDEAHAETRRARRRERPPGISSAFSASPRETNLCSSVFICGPSSFEPPRQGRRSPNQGADAPRSPPFPDQMRCSLARVPNCRAILKRS